MNLAPEVVRFYDRLSAPVYISDRTGELLYFNKAAAQAFGVPDFDSATPWLPECKIYLPGGTSLSWDDTPMRRITKTLAPAINQELIVRTLHHEYQLLQVNSTALYDPENIFDGAVHTLTDVTSQQNNETRQAMLAAIIESSEDAIISKDLNGIITSWNSAAERLFGYEQAEAIGRHITILIPHDRLEEETLIIGKVVKGETLGHFETLRLRKGGIEVPVSVTVSPIKDSFGRVIGASKIVRNISKQKESEARLQQYAENLEILNTVSKVISENMDVQEILQKVTDATTQLTGAAFGAFFYNVMNESGEAFMLYTLSGAPKEAFEKLGMPRNTQMFQPTFSGEGIVRIDDINKDPRYGKNAPNNGLPTGHLPVVSYMAIPVIARSGRVIGGLLYGHPQPAMFTAEHERLVEGIVGHASLALDNARMYEEIKTLNTKKDEFIGLASHELKTPLTSLSGYLQIMAMNPADGIRIEQFIGKARQQMGKVQGLVSDLLDVSKIATGKLPLKLSTFGMIELLNEVAELIQLSNTSHHIHLNLPADEIPVFADRVRIEQVIINLVTNAIRYSPKANEVFIELTVTKNKVKVGVKDLGIGIDPAHLKKIFTRFYRVDDMAAHMSGLGIGLYISNDIITRHHGKLNVESELGKGSVFSFEIPVKQTDPA